MLAGISDEGLLLQEHVHRVANELFAALAALRMVRPASGSRTRWRLLAAAIERLEGFAAVNRALALPVAAPVRLSAEMDRLCVGLGAARGAIGSSRIVLDVRDFAVDGATARRVLMVGAELVHNAIRHALEGRDGLVRVSLRLEAREVVLGVEDDGPGMAAAAATRGSGMGGFIVRELVRRAGGTIECATGPGGTVFRVAIPHGTALDEVAGGG